MEGEEKILELRERCRKIFSILSCPVKYSVRKISKLVEISKSSVHRHAKAIERRNLYPESFFWEISDGRGISIKLLKTLTVIHNFGLTRSDGKTAAKRLFERDFPDLFEWIVNQMGELPLARMGRKLSSDNLFNLQSVPT